MSVSYHVMHENIQFINSSQLHPFAHLFAHFFHCYQKSLKPHDDNSLDRM